MNYIPEPVTRTDKYLAYIAGNIDVALPDHPITRKEHYLAAWAEKSGFEDVEIAGEPPLTLENAIGKSLKGLKIYGKSKQVTTTGAQLLEKNEVVHPPNGKVSTIVLFEGELSGTYTVSCALEGNAQYPTRAALEIIVDGISKFCTINNHTVATGTITKIVCFAQKTYCDFTGTLHIMLNAGSAPLPWEPYTGGKPSPSPDYPQEIESIGQGKAIRVGVRGKNLLDPAYVYQNTISNYRMYKDGFLLKKGVTYTLSCYPSKADGLYIIDLSDYDKLLAVSYKKSFVTYTPNEDVMVTFNYYLDGKLDPKTSKLMLEIGENPNPSYEPYHEPQTTDIATPNGLPGIPVASGGNYTDADGQQWICDEIDLAREVYVRRVWKGVFDGSDDERWEIYNNTTYAGFYLTNVFAEKLTMRDGIANTYKVDNSYIPTEAVWIGVNETSIYIKNSRFYDDTLSDKGLSNFKDSLAAHPMTVMTYLDSSIETPLTSDQLAAYKQLHTYKGTTIIDNDAGAYMSVKYEKMK